MAAHMKMFCKCKGAVTGEVGPDLGLVLPKADLAQLPIC